MKNMIKWLIRLAVDLLPPQLLRQVIHASPSRLLHIFNYSWETGQVPYELWDISSGPEGHMMIQGCDCVSLAKQYGTPLHVVDKNRLKKNYFSFYDSFRKWYPRIEICYSYKTNPIPGVIRALHEFGAGAEVVSPYELRLALTLGVPPERIIYNGPGKTDEGLTIAVSNKIKLINIDGPSEIETIDRLARQNGHKQQVGVRVVTSVGWKRKFGFSIESGEAFRAYQRLNELQNLVPCGLHFHLGTDITNINTYLRAIKETIDLSMLLKRQLGITLRYFDFGGGFYVPSIRVYSELDNKLLKENLPLRKTKLRSLLPLSEYGRAITELFGSYYPPDLDDPVTIILEPGRAITSSSQSLLLKVLDTKPPLNGITDVILDGGNNFALPLEWERHEIIHATNMNAPADSYYKLFGPLCTPTDVLFQVKRLPRLERGDILAIMDAGAYFTSTQSNFCFFPRPPTVLVKDLHHDLIRKRESFEDMIAQDFPGQWQHSKDRAEVGNQKPL